MSEPIRLAKGGTKITTFSPSVARDYEAQGFVRIGIDGQPLEPVKVEPDPAPEPVEPEQEPEPDPAPTKKGKKGA